MIFISLGKFRKKATKEMTEETSRIMQESTKEGVKFIGFYWTLGRFDTVVIMEAPDEKVAMKGLDSLCQIPPMASIFHSH